MRLNLKWRFPSGFSPSTPRRVFSRFAPALAGQRTGVLLGICLATLGAMLELLRPWPLKLLIDGVLVPKAKGIEPDLGGWTAEELLALAAVSVLVLSGGIGVVSVWVTMTVAKVGRKVATRIRRMVFDHLHRLALPFHHSAQSGDLLVRLMGDVNMVRELLFSSWVNVISRGALFLGTAALLLLLDFQLALVPLATVPLLFLGVTLSGKKLKIATRKQRRKEGQVAAFAGETLQRIELVKAYASEERTTSQFSRFVRASEKADLKAKRIAAGMGRYSEVLTGLGLSAVFYLGALRVFDGELLVGEFLVFLSYSRSLFKPLRKLSGEAVRISKASACADRLLAVLDRKPEDDRSGVPAPKLEGRIEFRNLHLIFANGAEALRGVDLEIPAGTLVAITGENGAGKSTVLGVLLRLLEPSEGRVLIDRRPIRDFQLSSYRDRFAYVPQQIQLFGASVRENLLYGNPSASHAEIEKAASGALCDDFIRDLPEGFETVLEEGGIGLSGGQARRLMLARAAVRAADVLLLDEPLTGLDPEARAVVSRAIRSIGEGRTTIVVSHSDVESLDPDLVIRLDRGRVAEVVDRDRTRAVEAGA